MADILDGKLNVDMKLNEGGYDYFGYMGKDGSWVIMRTIASTGAEARFIVGVGVADYVNKLANRTGLVYGYPVISGYAA